MAEFNFLVFSQIVATHQGTLQFLRDNFILRRNKICCRQNCSLHKNNCQDGEIFRCRVCRKKYSIRSDSFFSRSHLSLRVLLTLLYTFACNLSVTQALELCKGAITKKTVIQWYTYFRDLMSRHLENTDEILGTNVAAVVEMDETFFKGKRKYHRGAFRRESKTLFGMIDTVTKKIVLRLVEDKKRATLLPIIVDHTAPNAKIHTDEAPMYKCLNNMGYTHRTVCHKREFVNSLDGTHTNTIECLWSHLKAHFKIMRGTCDELLPHHLDEFMYRWNRKREGHIFKLLLQDMADFYNVQ